MNIDGFLLHKILLNLEDFRGKRVKKIYQSSRFNFYFKFDKNSIQVSTDPSNPFLTSVDEKEEYSFTSPFLTFLRRNLTGMFLEEISQFENDRIVFLSFIKKNVFGETVRIELVIELMGPNSNIIIIDDKKKIVLILKRKISSKRTLMEGSEYSPLKTSKIPLSELNRESFMCTEISGHRDLMGLIQGISSKTAKFLIEGTINKSEIWENIIKLKESYLNSEIYLDLNTEEIFPFRPENSDDVEKINILNYINANVRRGKIYDDLNTYRNKFLKIVKKELDKKTKLQNGLQRELSSVKDFDEYKNYGNLIISNIYKIPDNIGEVELFDWQENKNIKISMDPNLTPSQNSQKYFKYYERAKRKYNGLLKRLKSIEKDIEYLNQLHQMIDLCDDRNEIDEIKSELQKNNFLKSTKRIYKVEKTKKKSEYRTYNYKGFQFLVGKNNFQNDKLTKSAAKDDYWFHAKEIPGAHVILKTAGKEPQEDVILYGVSLAAYFSKGRNSSKVNVAFTRIKYVWKPKGAKPGMVLYKNEKSYTATPKIKEENN
jgi:predicted ribosome quality control (RQC) complex YloA/Tae2 family protein